ncbi:hypothetical protein, partial [Serratia silvae]
SICITYVNDTETFYNYYEKGPLTSGVNITPYLMNGKNSLSVAVAGLGAFDGDDTYPSDAKCELRITAATPQGETEIAKIIATSNEKSQPTGASSPKESGTMVTESMVKDTFLYKVKRNFTIQGIPEWAWTKATPFEPNVENMTKLHQAYMELRQLMLNKDATGIQRMAQFSFSEKEVAESLPSGSWYQSLFEDRLPKIDSAKPINWDEYELISINNGRLVKLDSRGNSPLQLLDKNGDFVSGYAPYFSLINGKMVLTR